MSEERPADESPLVQRVDALLRSHRGAQPSHSDVPVLTDIVELEPDGQPRFDPAALEALALERERPVLARLGEELDRAIEQGLARALAETLDGMRADLTATVREMVRDAVAASVESALKTRSGAAAPAGRGEAPKT